MILMFSHNVYCASLLNKFFHFLCFLLLLHRSPVPHTSLVVGELVVLAMRVCMPIHVICSVMQATTFSKVKSIL